jgi:hypothetical protein
VTCADSVPSSCRSVRGVRFALTSTLLLENSSHSVEEPRNSAQIGARGRHLWRALLCYILGALPADLAGKESAPLVAIRTLAQMLAQEMEAGYLAVRDAPSSARQAASFGQATPSAQTADGPGLPGLRQPGFAGLAAHVPERDAALGDLEHTECDR